jgi:4-alpha-glucanotransferase
MGSIEERAAQWGIETQYWDGLGRHRTVEPDVLARLLDIFDASGQLPAPNVETPPAIPAPAYQAGTAKMWTLAFQLYGVRSRRNWGHGDFTDLKGLIELAAQLGASGVGLNPLHALFDDSADAYSPYSPSSRHFLNSHYIDPDAIPEFPGATAAGLTGEIAALRDAKLIDYAGVIKAKSRALELAYEAFRLSGAASRRSAFAAFRKRSGALLTRYSCFEFLRRKFGGAWWTWPQEWQKPNVKRLADLRKSEHVATGYHEFVQWVADEQLSACSARAEALGLEIGLYLDIAVGVRADGFDAWNEQALFDRALEIGAPPDRLNLEGQRWGLAGINPLGMAANDCASFRRMLRASMRYAGAVRIDHVLGLKRLYLIPQELRADSGAYVRLGFASLLAAAAEESIAHRCVVIGEDLGTVPDGFREALAEWGIWSYQVMMFQRAEDGGFIAPDLYVANALVTFATHDLPTFAGWKSGHDLIVKRALGMNPGETDAERAAAREALGRTMAWRGYATLDFPSVVKFLAETPSRLLAVSAEDALELLEQVNVPGTIAEHPNWHRRLPTDLEGLKNDPRLQQLADILSAAGRAGPATRPGP